MTNDPGAVDARSAGPGGSAETPNRPKRQSNGRHRSPGVIVAGENVKNDAFLMRRPVPSYAAVSPAEMFRRIKRPENGGRPGKI